MKDVSVTGHQMLVRLHSLFSAVSPYFGHDQFCEAFVSVCSCVDTDLEVYVLNTEADIQDLTFPHSYDSDSILQISALALQQYSNNGRWDSLKLHNNQHSKSSALYSIFPGLPDFRKNKWKSY